MNHCRSVRLRKQTIQYLLKSTLSCRQQPTGPNFGPGQHSWLHRFGREVGRYFILCSTNFHFCFTHALSTMGGGCTNYWVAPSSNAHKTAGKWRGRHDSSDAEIALTQSDEEEKSLPKKKRKRVLATFKVVQRWVTGDRAEQPEEDTERQILEQARLLMHLSGLKLLPNQTSLATDLYLWKKAGRHIARRTICNSCRCMTSAGYWLAAIFRASAMWSSRCEQQWKWWVQVSQARPNCLDSWHSHNCAATFRCATSQELAVGGQSDQKHWSQT